MNRQPPKRFLDHPFPYHHELELEIVSLTNLGLGIGKVDGWVVMIPHVIPGERVRVRIFRNHKNYSEADLLAVLTPSSDRVEPPCTYFGVCGGCQYQHMRYPAQLDWKRRHVQDCLRKLAGIEVEVPVPIHTTREFHYRSKLTPHHQPPRGGKLGPVGFLESGSRTRIVDIPHCIIATEAINETLTSERIRLSEAASQGKLKRGSTLLLRHALEGVTTNHAQIITEQVGNRQFQFKAGDFFQNNPWAVPHMLEYVVGQASATSLPYLIDAYCGSGLFSIGAADHFQRCVGVEISESSVQWARSNATLNAISNCEYLVGDASAIFADIPFSGIEAVLLIDPPRRGCDQPFLDQVAKYQPSRIVYVSCDPATQARDLGILFSMGYTLKAVQPVDLFPQTRHIENVVTLDAGNQAAS